MDAHALSRVYKVVVTQFVLYRLKDDINAIYIVIYRFYLFIVSITDE